MITNFFSPLEFQVSVSRMPNVEFFTQRISIPSISGETAIMVTPFNPLHFTPDKLQFSPLDLQFIVDEKMENYIEMLNWIKGSTFPENYEQFKNLAQSKEGIFSDITILMANSSKNIFMKAEFKNCTPTSLSEIQLDTTIPDVVYPVCTATFAYSYFNISPYKDLLS